MKLSQLTQLSQLSQLSQKIVTDMKCRIFFVSVLHINSCQSVSHGRTHSKVPLNLPFRCFDFTKYQYLYLRWSSCQNNLQKIEV